jgi:DNA-binding transcriptional regulator YdaS (Cro superfamily)
MGNLANAPLGVDGENPKGSNAPMLLIDYLAAERGRAAALARAIDVKPAQIGKWVKGVRPIPTKKCVRIERVTAGQVTRRELRADWAEIWPELERRATHTDQQPADRPQAHTAAASAPS